MFHGMYEHRDEYGNRHYLSARIGGFASVKSATKAITKRSPVGYVADAKNVILHIVRNGRIIREV